MEILELIAGIVVMFIGYNFFGLLIIPMVVSLFAVIKFAEWLLGFGGYGKPFHRL